MSLIRIGVALLIAVAAPAGFAAPDKDALERRLQETVMETLTKEGAAWTVSRILPMTFHEAKALVGRASSRFELAENLPKYGLVAVTINRTYSNCVAGTPVRERCLAAVEMTLTTARALEPDLEERVQDVQTILEVEKTCGPLRSPLIEIDPLLTEDENRVLADELRKQLRCDERASAVEPALTRLARDVLAIPQLMLNHLIESVIAVLSLAAVAYWLRQRR